MENKFYFPKEEWGDGPWVTEPDEATLEYKGYESLQQRNKMGAWCGYVRVPMNIATSIMETGYDSYDNWSHIIDAHGRLTYAGETTDGFIVIGFDCGHHDDLIPTMKVHFDMMDKMHQIRPMKGKSKEWIKEYYYSLDPKFENYKTLEFVQNECKSIVDQLEKLSNKE